MEFTLEGYHAPTLIHDLRRAQWEPHPSGGEIFKKICVGGLALSRAPTGVFTTPCTITVKKIPGNDTIIISGYIAEGFFEWIIKELMKIFFCGEPLNAQYNRHGAYRVHIKT